MANPVTPLPFQRLNVADQRRALARYAFQFEARCKAVGPDAPGECPARVFDLSAKGLGLMVGEPFEPGSLLSVTLDDTPQSIAGALLVQVMNVRRTEAGWLHGCSFVNHQGGVDMQAAFRVKLAVPPSDERRALLRFRLTLPATGRSLTTPAKTAWDGTTQDVSAGGIRICTAAPLTSGALVSVKIQGDGPATRHTLMARVLHVRAREEGGWEYGCAFTTRLALEELQALLKTGWSAVRAKKKGPLTVVGLALAARGVRLLTARRCGAMHLWDSERRQLVRTFERHTQGINAVALSATGRRALSGSDDGVVRLWDADFGRCLRSYRGHQGAVTGVAFLPDERSAASTGTDQTVRVWSLDKKDQCDVLKGHTKGVSCLAVSLDGRRVVTGSADNTVRLWDLTDLRELRQLDGHDNVVNGVAFSPDGRWVASGSADNTVRLWDAATGQEAALFTGHEQSVKCVNFSPDGTQLLSAGADQTVRIWHLATPPGAHG